MSDNRSGIQHDRGGSRAGVWRVFYGASGVFSGVAAPLILVVLGGCQSGPALTELPPEDSIRIALNAEELPNRRAEALEVVGDEIAAGSLDGEDVRPALKKLAWARANPPQVRNAAIDALAADRAEEADTRAMLRLMLPTESAAQQWGVIEHIGDLAAARGWVNLTPGFVASWARSVPGMPSDRRPERAALVKLHPDQSLEEVVFQTFAGVYDDGGTESGEVKRIVDEQRRAAWGVLCDLYGEDDDGWRPTNRFERRSTEEVTESILAFLSTTPARPDEPREMAVLRRCAHEFGTVPITREQLAWLDRLASAPYAEFWSAASSAVSGLGVQQREGLALRHLAPVVWAGRHESMWLTMSKGDLLALLEEEMAGEGHHRGGAMSRYDGTIRKAREDLVWGDALLLVIARRAIEEDAMAAQMFAQADQDHGDTSTEHGGVLDWRDGRFLALSYPPRPTQRLGDQRFVASQDLIDSGTSALMHYHFHVNSETNSRYAGPSVDDLEYARTFGRTCLVLTFINRERLNVDSYTPDGVVVDLGMIDRPAAP